ncbi:MAG: hypothetical protein RQ862_05175 [Candidatus Caldarchaeales archaeon]|jgi:hypothetical protein|nr:hypothetical protein [Candidatus Caldarchaeales archaeon]
MLPTRFVPIVTAGVGSIKKMALQNALQFLGIDHLQFWSVTSVLPATVEEGNLDELRQLPIGYTLPAILSVCYVPLPVGEPRFYEAVLYIFPAYRTLSPSEKFYLVLEDCPESPVDARLVSDVGGLKSAVVSLEYLHQESVHLGLTKWLSKVGPVERRLAASAAVTSVKMVISLSDSKTAWREWLVDELQGQRWLCLLSGIVFIQSHHLMGGGYEEDEVSYCRCGDDCAVGAHT